MLRPALAGRFHSARVSVQKRFHDFVFRNVAVMNVSDPARRCDQSSARGPRLGRALCAEGV
ncbi:hypothetical protein VI03_23635 [Burkholderia vietnamiensis]|nr:hypothetical protein VI03_23635 [Burkholderia vietnamiensis]